MMMLQATGQHRHKPLESGALLGVAPRCVCLGGDAARTGCAAANCAGRRAVQGHVCRADAENAKPANSVAEPVEEAPTQLADDTISAPSIQPILASSDPPAREAAPPQTPPTTVEPMAFEPVAAPPSVDAAPVAPVPTRRPSAKRPPAKSPNPAKPPSAALAAAPSELPTSPPTATATPPQKPMAPPPEGRPPLDYLAAVQARLARYKVYPRPAQLARQEGAVLIRFTIAGDGTIIDWAIIQGSGHDSLDRAAEALVQRASPLPPLPVELGRDRLEITLPVQYALR